MPKSRRKKKSPKRVLALPDLEQAKSPVLNTLTSRSGQRTYDHAITEFVEWYCSEPSLAFNRAVVLRYRISLQQKQYDFFDINVRNGEIILKPVRVNASELLTSVRRKVKRLEVSEQDVEAAIRWARKRWVRVVVDTNAFIAAALFEGRTAALLTLWQNRKIRPVLSAER